MHKSFLREVALVFVKVIAFVVAIFLTIIFIGFLYDYEYAISDGQCNVALFPVEGIILPYHGIFDAPLITTPSTFEEFLTLAESDENIKAVMLEINSPGGTPVASERIAEAVRASSLPVVGLIGDQAASGGYMVAAATDYLLASAMSDVGSIGVTMSYLEESEKLDEEGISYVQLTTGKFKDAGSPYRPITEEERELFQRDLDLVHNHFIDMVTRYRSLDREKVAELADGSSMVGLRAAENGLIDEIGGVASAQQVIANITGVEQKDVILCDYEQPFPFL